jgi:hypothetical protein
VGLHSIPRVLNLKMFSILKLNYKKSKLFGWHSCSTFLECSTLLYSSKNFKNCRTFKIVFEVFNLEGFPHQDKTFLNCSDLYCFVVLSKKWFSSKNFDDVRTTPLKLTNKGAPGSFSIGSEKNYSRGNL